jgi:hypothetical protein
MPTTGWRSATERVVVDLEVKLAIPWSSGMRERSPSRSQRGSRERRTCFFARRE